ncbi:glycosyltransferase, partial [Klebsiella pneumoniae]
VMIAGDGDEEYIHTLKTIAYENKINAVFLGNMNANEFLDTIDLLVVPSLWQEPFGRVVIESLGRKVPVAAKSSGGIPELLENNKNFLFNSSEQLTNIIVMYFNFQIQFKFDTVAFETETILSKWS